MTDHEHEARAARLLLAVLDDDRTRFDATLAETGVELDTPAAGLLGVLASSLASSLIAQAGEPGMRKILERTITDVQAANEDGRG